ncbi:MAG: PLP-dependent transferase [Dysgonamonadaceae bacterium]|jgi:O-acetylhomoserine (thiol)-lyase|nr:PLP-dependent transferase [Dysgonamonadaceae bacterium]
MDELNFESKLLSTPFPKKDNYNSLSMPVYNTAAYEFDTAEEMEAAFCGKTPECTYSRIANPTVQYFENRVKTVTGAFAVTALNSGMAAITNTIMSLAYSGCNIITSRHLFGNTYSFFVNTLKPFGVEIRFCDLTNVQEVSENIDTNTCALFLEIITNPQMEVADLAALSAVAHANRVPLIADSTIIPFSTFHAKDFGVDIEIVSSTKYISGGATGLGGLIIDYSIFDWAHSPRLKDLARQFGNNAFFAKLRQEIHRNFGAYMTPQTAYMQALGLETMEIRFQRESQICTELAKRLKSIPEIEGVNYTGLPDNPFSDLSLKQFGQYPGAMLTFDLASKKACYSFMNKLKLIRRATNLFDNKSLIIHPASTIFGTFTQQVRDEMNVSDKTLRLSVGLESADDLWNDILQALEN